MSEKLCLQWNDFNDRLICSVGALKNDSNFTDVTLACEDGTQLEAHKVILASSSPRVAKCQYFTQIILVQLNLPQEKARKSRQVFYILSIKWA